MHFGSQVSIFTRSCWMLRKLSMWKLACQQLGQTIYVCEFMQDLPFTVNHWTYDTCVIRWVSVLSASPTVLHAVTFKQLKFSHTDKLPAKCLKGLCSVCLGCSLCVLLLLLFCLSVSFVFFKLCCWGFLFVWWCHLFVCFFIVLYLAVSHELDHC